MVLVHSFYLVGALNFVQGVVAHEFLGSQPLSRLANGFIVEYADDPQTHSEVSRSLMMSELRFTERGNHYESLWAVLVIWKACALLLPCRLIFRMACTSSWAGWLSLGGAGERVDFELDGSC